MIKSIQLQNWRSHKESCLEFKKGTNVLIGPMGGGKSSIMDAICFGLFGTFPALNSRRVSLEETIMQKPVARDFAVIKLCFAYNNKNFVVERTIFKGNKASEAKLYHDSRLIAGPKPAEVNQRIEQELQVGFGLFSRAVYSEQNQIDFFLKLSPKERKQKFDELLEINRYETARQNAVSVGNRIKKMLEDKKKWVAEQKQQFKEEDLEKIKKQVTEKKTVQKEWEEKSKNHMEKALLLSEGISSLEESEKKLKQLREKEIQCASRIDSIEKALAVALKNIQNRSSQELTKQILELKEKEKNILEEKNEITKKQEKTSRLLSECTQEKRVFREKIAELEKSLKGLGKLTGNCPLCRRELKEHEKNQLEKEILEQQKNLEEQADKKNTEEKKITITHEEFEKELEKNREKSENTRDLRIKTEFIIKQALEIEEQQKQLELEKQRLKEFKAGKESIAFDEQKLLKQRQELMKEKTLEIKAREESKNCLEITAMLEGQAKKLEQVQLQLKKLKAQTKSMEQTTEKIGLFTVSLQTVQASLRESMLEAINQAMHVVWQKAYPYSDFETTRLIVENGDYEVKVKTKQGNWIKVEGNLSGGERSTVALCIRMAFSLVLTQNLSWLILDEPTHNLDYFAVQELAELFKTRLPELVSQIFVITHEKQLEKAASGSLYKISRDKNSDGISIPEEKPF